MTLNIGDKSSNNNTFTNNNAVTDNTSPPFADGGKNTDAATFASASSQYLSASSIAAYAPSTYTMEAWIKSGSNSYGGILGKDSSSNGRQFFWVVSSAGAVSIEHAGGSNGIATSTDTVPRDGAWHHVAIVYSGGTISAMYIDTVSAAFGISGTFSNLVDQSAQPLNVGRRAYPSFEAYFDGSIDEVRFWNTARTAQNISDNYQHRLVGNESGLILYLPFETESSASASLSPSASTSPSASLSPSSSASASLSPSASASASASRSLSPSASASPSASKSPSASNSPSLSPSASMSPSFSASASASPSTPPANFSRQASISLPTTKNDLSTLYTPQEVIDVSTDDGIRVDQESSPGFYLLHEYKIRHGNNHDTINVEIDVQTTLAPSTSPVYLQIWNTNTSLWETLATDQESAINTDFQLTGVVSDNLVNYYDEIHDPVFNVNYTTNEITIRVYQNNPA